MYSFDPLSRHVSDFQNRQQGTLLRLVSRMTISQKDALIMICEFLKTIKQPCLTLILNLEHCLKLFTPSPARSLHRTKISDPKGHKWSV